MLAGTLAAIFILLLACTAERPTPALIEMAKDETRMIMDSLRQDTLQIIGEVDLTSEFFEENAGNYVLNYQVETGIDSSNLISTDATAYLSKKDGVWVYRLMFDRAYVRQLEPVNQQ